MRWRKPRQPAQPQPLSYGGLPYVVDVQDDPEYWNVPGRLLEDTCKATIHQVRDNPLAGFSHGALEGDQSLADWMIRHGLGGGSQRVMELGCGGGRMGIVWHNTRRTRFEDEQTEIWLTDHAPGAVEITAARVEGLGYSNIRTMCVKADDRRTYPTGLFDIIYTHTMLQHNSGWKQDSIFEAVKALLVPGGIFYLWNEKTFSHWEDPHIELTPSFHDDRESAGTAVWWVQRVGVLGFELLDYYRCAYTFRKM